MFAVVFCVAGRDMYAAQIRKTDVSKASSGNALVTVRGNFYTLSKKQILNKINAIRREACNEGIVNPATGRKLKPSDYKPLKWSSDLEWIAQTRAAEATILTSHQRPNGKDCFSCTHNGEQSWGENLAWNWDGIMFGIGQWYDEKSDWIKACKGKAHGQTGHYESLISTDYNHMAIGCFRLSSGGWYTVSQEFSYKTGLNENAIGVSGLCDQVLEVPKSIAGKYTAYPAKKTVKVKSISLNKTRASIDLANRTKTIKLKATLTPKNPTSRKVTWKSSDTSVATVTKSGLTATVRAKKKGTTTITAKTSNGKSAKCKVTVKKTVKKK